MKKLFLTLFTMPTVVGLFLPLVIHNSAHATQTKKDDRTLCLNQHNKTYCVTQARPDAKLANRAKAIGADFEAGITFTDEESDAAVKKFGCDCPACIRAIKQIRVFTNAN
jgi:flavin-dependent dehydrogenase